MLRKLIVVYNPRSSHHQAIQQEVLAPLRKLEGWLVGKYEVRETSLDENARELAKLLNDGDLVIVAGGDGTAAMAANGVMLSEKDVALGVMGYGNFDDMARMLRTKRPVEYGGEYVGGVSEIIEKFEAGKVTEIYPLEAKVDGKHWRYAPCYLTIGLLAESTGVFDEEKVREKLKTGKKGLVFSLWQLAKWYFWHHKQEFLAEGELKQDSGKKGSEDKKVETAKEASEKEAVVTEVAVSMKMVSKAEKVEKKEPVKGQKVEKAEKTKPAVEKQKQPKEKVIEKKMPEEKMAKEETAERKAIEVEALRKELTEKRAARKQKRQEWLKDVKKKIKKVWKKVKKWCRKAVRKAKSGAAEVAGRSKARVSDVKVQTEVKVAQARQKRQEKHERELKNKPEIIIDTEMTRAEKQKKEEDEDEN